MTEGIDVRFCKKCKISIPLSDNFCSKCGRNFSSIQKSKPKSKRGAKIRIIIGVIGMIIGATVESSIQAFPIVAGAVVTMIGIFEFLKK